MTDPYEDFVKRFAEAANAPLPSLLPATPPITGQRPMAMLFSPHPDDETFTGGLALRLWMEAAWQVANVPVSYGSDPRFQEKRRQELKLACGLLGFSLIDSLCHSSPSSMSNQRVMTLLEEFKPEAILCPHAADDHPTHRRTHQMVTAALAEMDVNYTPYVIFTESYTNNKGANLLVALSHAHVARMVKAMCAHESQVERHPFHRRLPAFLMGKVAYRPPMVSRMKCDIADITFADLYQIHRRTGGRLVPQPPCIIRCTQPIHFD
jgi:LmbE family N-acetylglucosaminyl deacetylase